MDEQEWLDDFQRRVAGMREKSMALQGRLGEAEGTARSSDGLVSVTVTPNGALKDLRIDDRALRASGGAQLTAAIMAAYGKAQRQVSREVAAALEPLAGGTEMMNVVRSFLPQPEDEPERDAPRQPGEPEAEDRPVPPTGAAPPRVTPGPGVPPRVPPAGPPQAGPPAPPQQPGRPSGPHRRRMDGDDDEMQPW
ncbi:MAG TPA: YbaB/EbfC family nucleoid-associated protein [Amycolatopsis sp.]|nr:YbaB/EbfC family nucleoid-associated protein [Amycolatopsis sp.]